MHPDNVPQIKKKIYTEIKFKFHVSDFNFQFSIFSFQFSVFDFRFSKFLSQATVPRAPLPLAIVPRSHRTPGASYLKGIVSEISHFETLNILPQNKLPSQKILKTYSSKLIELKN